MVELLFIILIAPILFILVFMFKISLRLLNYALMLLVWAIKKLCMLVPLIAVWCYKGLCYLWRRYRVYRQTQKVEP